VAKTPVSRNLLAKTSAGNRIALELAGKPTFRAFRTGKQRHFSGLIIAPSLRVEWLRP
jgi:hypothetical protein